MELKKTRLAYIDLIETIAILFVVAYHLALNPADGSLGRSPAVIVSYFTNTILSTCVPLFFFANGHLLLNRSFVLKKHVRKMLVRGTRSRSRKRTKHNTSHFYDQFALIIFFKE